MESMSIRHRARLRYTLAMSEQSEVWRALQLTPGRTWSSHRAAVRAWILRAHPSAVPGSEYRSRKPGEPTGFAPQLGDIARIGATMTELGVKLEAPLGRALVSWALAKGRGWGGDDPKLKALALRIKRALRKQGIVTRGAETHTILSYKDAEEDGQTHKYAISVDSG